MALILFIASPFAGAEDFKIGILGPPSSMDPHASSLDANVLISSHMFEGVTRVDADNKLIPQLAQSWKNVDRLTWEFKLRQGVKFHDGSVMTAEDVVYSLERVKMYKVGGFAEAVLGMTFRIVTPNTAHAQ